MSSVMCCADFMTDCEPSRVVGCPPSSRPVPCAVAMAAEGSLQLITAVQRLRSEVGVPWSSQVSYTE